MRLTALALAVLAGPAFAQEPCPPAGGQAFAVLEAAKSEFLTGDYAAFHGRLARFIRGTDFQQLFNPLIVAAPQGFPSCTTVLQRVETGGMVQEVILFELSDGFPLGLYLLAAPVRGELSFLSFKYSTSIGDVMDELR